MKETKEFLIKEKENLKVKKKLKSRNLKERGITLIALVVTIIVLLILTGVTLNIALSDNGLFSKAKKATEEYKQAQSEEEDLILKYEYEMAQLQGEISETETFGKYVMEKEIKEKYGQNIKIGDTVNYNDGVEEYDGTWKVLGIENGQLLLISSKPINNSFELKGVDGYVNGVKELDKLCSEFSDGDGAVDARSLRVKDINRITGYNPDRDKKYGKNEMIEYGGEVTVTRDDNGKIVVSYSERQTETLDISTFEFINENGRREEFTNRLVMSCNVYEYIPSTGLNWYSGDEKPVIDDESYWNGLFDNYNYWVWLADKAELFTRKGPGYDIRCLGYLSGCHNVVSHHTLFGNPSSEYSASGNVACVVALRDEVKFTRSSSESRGWEMEE